MISNTCCFTGHRRLPKDQTIKIIELLIAEVDKLIEQGVTNFISGGALGFDLLAATVIIEKKKIGLPLTLIFALPCQNHDFAWPPEEQRRFRKLMRDADEIVYVSDAPYADGCMKKRNQYMVARSGFCICAFLYERSGTAQTVRYATQTNRKIINIFSK